MNAEIYSLIDTRMAEYERRYKTKNWLHLVLSVLTGGLWLVIWLIVGIYNSTKWKNKLSLVAQIKGDLLGMQFTEVDEIPKSVRMKLRKLGV